MGLRYRRILDAMGHTYKRFDQDHNVRDLFWMARGCDGILIATPTMTHQRFVEMLVPLRKPILCEKPLATQMTQVFDMLERASHYRTPFRMVNQYAVLPNGTGGVTSYNYFRHGGDGLAWDCIQIIGLARGRLVLGDDSPVWKCSLNGRRQLLSMMDTAYMRYLDLWFQKPKQDLGYLIDIHQKTDYLARGAYGTH
jgi:hypothetical protein